MTPALIRLLDRGEALVRTRGGFLSLLALAVVVLTALGAGQGGALASASEPALAVLVLVAVVLGAVAAAGVVSGELGRGATLLWVQKPGGGVVTYLFRLGERIVLGWILVLGLAGAQAGTVALVEGAGSGGEFLLQSTPLALLLVPLGASVTWVVSSTGVEGDAALSLLLIPLWILGGSLLESLTGIPPGVARLLEVTAPPRTLLAALPKLYQGGGFPGGGPALHYLAWIGAVVLAGGVVLSMRLRRPFAVGSSR